MTTPFHKSFREGPKSVRRLGDASEITLRAFLRSLPLRRHRQDWIIRGAGATSRPIRIRKRCYADGPRENDARPPEEAP